MHAAVQGGYAVQDVMGLRKWAPSACAMAGNCVWTANCESSWAIRAARQFDWEVSGACHLEC